MEEAPACKGCRSLLGKPSKQPDTAQEYEIVYETYRDKEGDFIRCPACGGRNYFVAESAEGLRLTAFEKPEPATGSKLRFAFKPSIRKVKVQPVAAEPQQVESRRVQRRSVPSLPHGITVEESSFGLKIVCGEVRWLRWLYAAVLPLLILSSSLLFLRNVLRRGDIPVVLGEGVIFLLLLLHFYRESVGNLNRTIIQAGGKSLKIWHGPLPVPIKLTLSSSTVDQIFCREETHVYVGLSSFLGPTYYSTYSLHAVLKGGTVVRLIPIVSEKEEALWIELLIEQYLGIRDRVVDIEESDKDGIDQERVERFLSGLLRGRRRSEPQSEALGVQEAESRKATFFSLLFHSRHAAVLGAAAIGLVTLFLAIAVPSIDVSIQQTSLGLEIAWPWYSLIPVVLSLLGIFIGALFYHAEKEQNLSDFADRWPIRWGWWLAVGLILFCSYTLLTFVLNRTVIKVSREHVIATDGPLPWWGNRQAQVAAPEIDQLYSWRVARERESWSRRRQWGSGEFSIYIMARMKTGADRFIVFRPVSYSFYREDKPPRDTNETRLARLIEQQMENYLRIPDGPVGVKGEIRD